MLRNYLIISIRIITRNRGFSLINICGLSLGLACTLLILIWVQDELNFDRFHKNIEEIYRVEENQHYTGVVYHVNVTPYPSGPVWKEKIPEIAEAVRVVSLPGLLFRYGEKAFFEDNIRSVDSTIFNMFSFELLKGDPVKVLTDPYSVVLTDELANKYFGDEEPLGKIIRVNQYAFTVKGVVKKPPLNSSIRFSALVPFDFIKEVGYYSDSWGNNSITTFIMLHENTDTSMVNNKLTQVYKDHFPEGTTDFMAAPLKKMHLYSYFGSVHKPSNIRFVYIFSVVATIVLLIACINFMNLSTARAANRAREIGVRKAAGAGRLHLIGQFLGESLVMAFLAMIIALLTVIALLGVFNTLAGKEVGMSVLWSARFITGMVIITVVAGILAGLYPAVFLSSLNPVKVIKGEVPGMKKATLRKTLVVVQFAVSILLIIGTLVVYNQLNYMKSKDLGYDRDNLLYIPIRGEVRNAYERIRSEFLKNPDVVAISACSHTPDRIGSNSSSSWWPGKDPDMSLLITTAAVDFGFVNAMKIKIVEGRDFSEEYPADRAVDTIGNFLINEETARIMNVDQVVGSPFRFMGVSGVIVGVMKNFHYQPVSEEIEPLAMIIAPSEWLQYILVRIVPGDVSKITRELEKIWQTVLPSYPFDYVFLDEQLDNTYRTETRLGNLLKYFSVVAILVACLGLFALSSFIAEQRTREFGIRKAMGAGSHHIITTLARDTVVLVMFAIIIGVPLGWFIMNKWLQDFAYRVHLHWWLFLFAGALALIITLITVSHQAWKSGRTSPAEALRYE